MNYYAPCYSNLGDIGESMNPLQAPPVHLTSQAIAEGPTIVMGIPDAGHFEIRHAGLDGWRDAVDMLTAVNFLFPV